MLIGSLNLPHIPTIAVKYASHWDADLAHLLARQSHIKNEWDKTVFAVTLEGILGPSGAEKSPCGTRQRSRVARS